MSEERLQCPIRLHKDTYRTVKAKIQKDNISFQKLIEVMLAAYLKDNKEIMKIVEKHASTKHSKRRRYELNELEADALLREIEKNYSPLRELEEVIEDLRNE